VTAAEDRLDALVNDLRAFIAERDWAQFHAPRNLAAGVNVEAGELLEHFLWRDPTPEEVNGDARLKENVERETADVFLFTLLLAEKLDFDLVDAARRKLAENRGKYPVEKAKGTARKYTEL
jgi:dCTP diphosphatase